MNTMKEREIIAKEWRDDNGILHRREVGQELVRCKECKYERQCQKAVQHTTHEPTSVTIAYRPIDFCSYGERKESE